MIDISNLTLGQLEELQDKILIRIEYLKKEVRKGDCFVDISKESRYVCFYKVTHVENINCGIDYIAFDFSSSIDYVIDEGDASLCKSAFTSYISIPPKTYEKVEQLKIDSKSQLDKIMNQLELTIKTLIDG